MISFIFPIFSIYFIRSPRDIAKIDADHRFSKKLENSGFSMSISLFFFFPFLNKFRYFIRCFRMEQYQENFTVNVMNLSPCYVFDSGVYTHFEFPVELQYRFARWLQFRYCLVIPIRDSSTHD